MLQGEHSAILSTFIKELFVIKIFVLSIFEWPFYTGFSVVQNLAKKKLLYNALIISSHHFQTIFHIKYFIAHVTHSNKEITINN